MDFEPLIEKKRNRLAEIEQAMSAEDFYLDQRRATEFSQEYKYIKKLLANWERFAGLLGQLEDNRELAKGEDEEMAALAGEEIPELEKNVDRLGAEIQCALLPRDNTEDRDVIIEIRAGTGGDEASLFAGDVLRMYQRYAELQGWTVEPL